MNVPAKFEVRIALSVREITAIEVLGGGCEPQSWGRGGHRGSGMVPFEKSVGEFL